MDTQPYDFGLLLFWRKRKSIESNIDSISNFECMNGGIRSQKTKITILRKTRTTILRKTRITILRTPRIATRCRGTGAHPWGRGGVEGGGARWRGPTSPVIISAGSTSAATREGNHILYHLKLLSSIERKLIYSKTFRCILPQRFLIPFELNCRLACLLILLILLKGTSVPHVSSFQKHHPIF